MDLDKFKQKDMDFRKKIKAEIQRSREYLKNIIEELYEDGDFKKINAVKKVIDELDLLANDIGFAKSGHDPKIFSNRNPPDEKALGRVIHFNNFILEKIKNVTLASEQIADMMIDDDDLELPREMKKIKQYITKARNQYKKRDDLLKGTNKETET